jgi:glycoprotein endo-alpha-1,2-mannosidase
MAKKQVDTFIIFFASMVLLGLVGCSSPTRTTAPAEPQGNQKYLVGAYYYLWYPGNWREGFINGLLSPPQLPALGQYDSSDLKAIERQITWSSQYGITFWAISWWPGHPELDRIIREKILKTRNINDIKFCIFYETPGLGMENGRIDFTPDKVTKFLSDFQYLAQNYFSHPSYLKINGRPVIIIYLTRTFSRAYPEAISRLRENLKKMGFNPFLIGDEIFWNNIRSTPLPPSTRPNLNRIRLFDGITAYNMYDWGKPQQMGYGNTSTFLADVEDKYGEYQAAVEKEVRLIPSTIPGYNDRGVRLSEKHPVIPRQFQPAGEEGSFFAQALNRTVIPFIDADLPMALITSFNEWNEGTQIEPTVGSGLSSKDVSPSKTDYTQGYTYHGYGEKYLSILQDHFMAISGRVMDGKGKNPLSKVTLQVFKGEKLLAAGLTDSQGFFNLSRLNLPPGTYEIKAHFPGYKEIRSKVKTDEKKSAVLNLRLNKE